MSKQLRHFTQDRVIVRQLVMTHAGPVKSFGRSFGIRIVVQHCCISAFRIGPILVHERDASEAHFQLRTKFISWQIALETLPFYSVRIKDEHGWRPHCVKAMEVDRMFFDVCFERDEVVVDE